MFPEKDQSSLTTENQSQQPLTENNTNATTIDNLNNTKESKESNDSDFYDNMIFPS